MLLYPDNAARHKARQKKKRIGCKLGIDFSRWLVVYYLNSEGKEQSFTG